MTIHEVVGVVQFGWFYLTNLTAQTLRANSALICASWFFIGFAACHAVSSFH